MQKKLTKKDVAKLRKTLTSSWQVRESGDGITATFTFGNFIEAFMFVTRIGVYAEVMHHHPRIELYDSTVAILLTTDSVKGLSLNDFDLAAKIDTVFALSTKANVNRTRPR